MERGNYIGMQCIFKTNETNKRFQEIGYFFQTEKLIPSMKEHADYRLIRCPKCKKIVVLTKQDQSDWDNSLRSRKIKILKRQNME